MNIAMRNLYKNSPAGSAVDDPLPKPPANTSLSTSKKKKKQHSMPSSSNHNNCNASAANVSGYPDPSSTTNTPHSGGNKRFSQNASAQNNASAAASPMWVMDRIGLNGTDSGMEQSGDLVRPKSTPQGRRVRESRKVSESAKTGENQTVTGAPSASAAAVVGGANFVSNLVVEEEESGDGGGGGVAKMEMEQEEGERERGGGMQNNGGVNGVKRKKLSAPKDVVQGSDTSVKEKGKKRKAEELGKAEPEVPGTYFFYMYFWLIKNWAALSCAQDLVCNSGVVLGVHANMLQPLGSFLYFFLPVFVDFCMFLSLTLLKRRMLYTAPLIFHDIFYICVADIIVTNPTAYFEEFGGNEDLIEVCNETSSFTSLLFFFFNLLFKQN
jgi:hypothetical protein